MARTQFQRHPSIVPPYMLRAIARNARSSQLRNAALEALAYDPTFRSARTTQQLLGTRAHRTLLTTPEPQKHRTIYDAASSEQLPGKTVRTEGQSDSGDPAVDEAYAGLGATFDFYLAAYARNSIDDEGLALNATVHYGQKYDNAFWNGSQMVFGDGDGELFNRFTIAVDVIGHELTHGVTGDESKLVYLGQAGALNESISDVFGSLVKQWSAQPQQTADQADWLIGAGLFLRPVGGENALRSMAHPGTAYDDPELGGKDPQPADMGGFVDTTQDNGGVHLNSGIPNRAFYLVASQLGGYAWEKAGRIWYDTIRDTQLRSTATFQQFAALTAAHARQAFGADEQQVVINAWKQVKVTM